MHLLLIHTLALLHFFPQKNVIPNLESSDDMDKYIHIQWQDLSRVGFESRYSEDFQQDMTYPVFHKSVKALDGKKIKISGYFIPIDESPENPIRVLSANPLSSCYFCGAAGPETVMDLQPKEEFERIDMNHRVTFQGTLELNSDDLLSLYFILKDAELAE